MTPFEYILSLVSVLDGLAVTDQPVSLHRLPRVRWQVRRVWQPPAIGLPAALLALENWKRVYSAPRPPFYPIVPLALVVFPRRAWWG